MKEQEKNDPFLLNQTARVVSTLNVRVTFAYPFNQFAWRMIDLVTPEFVRVQRLGCGVKK